MTESVNVITEAVSRDDQNVENNRIAIYTNKDGATQKLKYSVRSNPYKSQCFARAHVWNELQQQWNLVHSIHPDIMMTKHGMCYWQKPKPITSLEFQDDMDELERVALLIVF